MTHETRLQMIAAGLDVALAMAADLQSQLDDGTDSIELGLINNIISGLTTTLKIAAQEV